MTFTKYTFAAAVLVAGVAGAANDANADCFVRGNGRSFNEQFQGGSPRAIWEQACKPFIQQTIASNNIRNGSFGMTCTGRLVCQVRGNVVNGRVQAPSVLNFGN